jgi:tetratricopeptide (TPR) repeat protein
VSEERGPKGGASKDPARPSADEPEVAIVELEDGDAASEDALDEVAEQTKALSDRPVTVGELMDGASKALGTAGTSARRLFDQGRYRKVRITRNGKPVLPDIPLAAFAAAEAASFAGAGVARALAGNFIGRFLFDVEVVNEADKYFDTGVERFLEGDLERAEQSLLKAVRIDDTHAGAYLQLGVLYRMQGETEKARAVLERALRLDDAGETGRKAGDVLRALDRDD